ncbi:hypothetical protein M9H77_36940 [Catharanthus roseus]|uniref:Uncharacterized protein n=1 Tax=Catharanthus roseus TaxID=4058 RepID=A0ACB9ZX11_CATRO|nr:hypothetical protein M9H77_36940 [Catharanthus roseus]
MCPTGTGAPTRETSTKSVDLRSAFDVLDVDRDGKISLEDLRTFYGEYYYSQKTINSSSSEEEDDVIGSMIFLADSNKDGFVEYDEFEKVILENSRKNIYKNGRKSGNYGYGLMEDAFRAMDKDGDGKVGHEDLKSYLTLAGFDAITDEDVKAMIRLAGGDQQNGGVTYQDLLRILSVNS